MPEESTEGFLNHHLLASLHSLSQPPPENWTSATASKDMEEKLMLKENSQTRWNNTFCRLKS
jgi:hypothetical protein